MPGGQDLHSVPCPGSCGRERVRTQIGTRPEVPGKCPSPQKSSQDMADGQTELTKMGSSPGGHCQGVVDVGAASGQGSTWKNGRQDTLERAESLASLGLSICHPLPEVPGAGTTHHPGPLPPGFRDTL